MNSFINRDFTDGWMIPETCVLTKHLHEALAILDAINAGELLAAVPVSADDRHRHQTALTLLDLLERTLRQALSETSNDTDSDRAANKEMLLET